MINLSHKLSMSQIFTQEVMNFLCAISALILSIYGLVNEFLTMFCTRN